MDERGVVEGRRRVSVSHHFARVAAGQGVDISGSAGRTGADQSSEKSRYVPTHGEFEKLGS